MFIKISIENISSYPEIIFIRKLYKYMKTMAGPEIQVLIEKLDTIKLELDYIKEHMVDADTVLTPE